MQAVAFLMGSQCRMVVSHNLVRDCDGQVWLQQNDKAAPQSGVHTAVSLAGHSCTQYVLLPDSLIA